MSVEMFDMPDDWEVISLGEVNTLKSRSLVPGSFPDEEFEYYSIPDYQNGQKPSIAEGKTIASAKLQLKPRSVLFGKLNPRVEKVWRVGPVAERRQIGSTEWIPVLPDERMDADFLYFMEWSDHVMPKAKKLVSGSTPSRQRVDPSSFYKIRVPLPPIHEQQRIAQVLSTVKQAIEHQERLIRTTTELKQALMQKLFTEGLRGEAQKETEIGLVPESWEVSTMGAEAAITKLAGYEYTKHIQYTEEGEIIAVRGMNLKDGKLDLTEVKRIWRDVSDALPRSQLHPGDVLLSYVGTVGSVALIAEDRKFHLAPNVAKLTSKDRKRLMPEYLLVYLRSDAGRSDLFRSVSKTSQPVISMARIRSLHLPLPGVEEQAAIVDTLGAVDGKLDAANRKRNAYQDLFRTLLHELMTGKVRVGTPIPNIN